MKTIMLVGYGRAGKDIGGEYLEKITGLKFAGTTSKYLTKYVAETLKISEEEAYKDRHENRMYWFNLGNKLRVDDPGFLIKQALLVGPITGGVRDIAEVVHARQTGLIDLIIWVENKRVDVDPTVTFGPQDCDYIVQNNGTIEEYQFKLKRLAKFAGLLKEENDNHLSA